MMQVTGPTSAVLGWNPVNPDSIRGHFKGYKIQTWTEEEGQGAAREIHAKGDSTQILVTQFKPDAKNFAHVRVYNARYTGPPSAVIDFDTPEGYPSGVQSLEAYPLGSSAFWLTWKKPLSPNGKLTGYKVYYEEVRGTFVGEKLTYEPQISDPRITSMKIAGFRPNTKYRLTIAATTKAGEGAE